MIPVAWATFLIAAMPRVAIVVHATGFSDDDARRMQDKVAAEVTSTGAELWTLSRALEVRSECLTDRQCARDVMRAADATYLVWIEATRAGGQVQLESHLLDVDGKSVAQDESASRADEVLGAGSLLPTTVSGPLRAAVTNAKASGTTATAPTTTPTSPTTTSPTTTSPTTTSPTSPTSPTTTSATTNASNATNAVEVKEKGPDAISPLAIGGMATIGVGAVLAIGGGAVAMTELGVVENPGALGSARVDAANVSTAMFVVAGAGVVAAGVGAVMLVLGL